MGSFADLPWKRSSATLFCREAPRDKKVLKTNTSENREIYAQSYTGLGVKERQIISEKTYREGLAEHCQQSQGSRRREQEKNEERTFRVSCPARVSKAHPVEPPALELR